MESGRRNFFYYRPAGETQHGPVTFDQLQQLIIEGKISLLTQVREQECLIWRYANEVPVLSRYFLTTDRSKVQDAVRKPLAELTAADVGALIGPYLRTGTTILFFFVYLPITLGVVFDSAMALILINSTRKTYSNIGINFSPIIPWWFLLAVAACLIALCVGPLAAWVAYARRRIKWGRFVLATTVSYVMPFALLAMLTLFFQYIHITWVTSDARSLFSPFR